MKITCYYYNTERYQGVINLDSDDFDKAALEMSYLHSGSYARLPDQNRWSRVYKLPEICYFLDWEYINEGREHFLYKGSELFYLASLGKIGENNRIRIAGTNCWLRIFETVFIRDVASSLLKKIPLLENKNQTTEVIHISPPGRCFFSRSSPWKGFFADIVDEFLYLSLFSISLKLILFSLDTEINKSIVFFIFVLSLYIFCAYVIDKCFIWLCGKSLGKYLFKQNLNSSDLFEKDNCFLFTIANFFIPILISFCLQASLH